MVRGAFSGACALTLVLALLGCGSVSAAPTVQSARAGSTSIRLHRVLPASLRSETVGETGEPFGPRLEGCIAQAAVGTPRPCPDGKANAAVQVLDVHLGPAVKGAREASYTIAIEDIRPSRLEIGPALGEYVGGIAKTSALGRYAGKPLWTLKSEDPAWADLILNGQGLLRADGLPVKKQPEPIVVAPGETVHVLLGFGVPPVLALEDLGVRFTSWFVHNKWSGARDSFYGFG